MKKAAITAYIGLAAGSLIFGCAKQPPPLTYLASVKPTTPISAQRQPPVEKSFPKGGWYFGNYNFRPASDVGTYVQQVEKEAKVNILKNADVEFNIPFALDIIFFGYNHGTDIFSVESQPTE